MLRTVCCVVLIALALAAPGCISVKTEGPAPTGYAAKDAEPAVILTGGIQVDVAGGF